MTPSPDIQTPAGEAVLETAAPAIPSLNPQPSTLNPDSPAPTYSWQHWRPHPILPALDPAEIAALASTPEGRQRIATLYNRREKRITLSETVGELLDYAFEPECWADADRDLANARTEGRDYGGVYVGGGKRSTKSTWAVRSALRSWLTYGNGIAWALSRVLTTSRGTIQRQMWEWLPKTLRALNDPSGKRKTGEITKIRYTVDGGFAADNVVFPNGTIVHFLSFTNDPTDYQGWEIGAPIKPGNIPKREHWPSWVKRWDEEGYAYDQRDVRIPNIGALLDEDAALRWINTVRDRLTTRNAKFIWPFTTEKGITLAVKETIGTPLNIETRPVDETLPHDVVLVPGCPVGHVPYRQQTSTPGVSAIYFHTRFNIFGNNYPNMRGQYRAATTPIKLANLFGYSEDVRTRAFPLFGGPNLVGGPDDRMTLPAEGTDYLIGDPAGDRNWVWIWVRIAPGMGKENWFIFDEWPDYATYREWAVPDESQPPNLDGVAGPAQRGLGWGIDQYKRMIAERERVVITPSAFEAVKKFLTERETHELEILENQQDSRGATNPASGAQAAIGQRRDSGMAGESPRGGSAHVGDEVGYHRDNSGAQHGAPHDAGHMGLMARFWPDPRKRKLALEAIAEVEDFEALNPQPSTLNLPVRERLLDPRAAGTEAIDKAHGRTLIDKFHDTDGKLPSLHFRAAPGLPIQTGIEAINDLLYFDKDQEMIPGLNFPRLFVHRKCRQSIWMLENYTASGGESGGCKDFADALRYAATSKLRHIAPGALQTKGGGRSY